MSDNRNNSGGGFLFGMLIGGALVFLLGTDKGRRILKSLTEEGFGELSQIIEKAEEEIVEEEERPIKKSKVVEEEEVPKTNGKATAVPKRRFFRRPTKS
ncbi:MAG: hypothetical protein HYU48_01595 [Candidatus Levybacteria bacterium]|nr:hypothetical protein [Candidatus Levybacteria bacterium]